MNTAMNTITYKPVSTILRKREGLGGRGAYDEITTQKRHNMKPAPERGTIRNDEHEYATCESRVGEKWLSAAAVGVVRWMFCAPAADEGYPFSFEGFAVG